VAWRSASSTRFFNHPMQRREHEKRYSNGCHKNPEARSSKRLLHSPSKLLSIFRNTQTVRLLQRVPLYPLFPEQTTRA
jgi:hypothetical protein